MPDGDEGTYRYLVNRGKKPLWRRVRKSSGETWQPNTSLLDFRDLGMICKECHKRIKYKDLDCVYELRSNELFRLWVCGYCDFVLKEDSIDELELRLQIARESTIYVGGGEYEE